MEFPGHERVLFYATPPNNYIGTGIFLSYIIIALYATITIISSLYIKYNQIFYSSDAAKIPASVQIARDARLRHVKIYAFLASISFATLSYHMLSFLIAHYVAWDGGKQFSLSVETLKSWMLQSSLFQDFAQDLVKDAPSAIWTQCAILATWFWNIWMAQKARQRALRPQEIWPFILLSQILPISFTASTFLIYLHLLSPDIQNSTHSTPPKPLPKTRTKGSLQIPTILINATLLSLPALRSHTAFIPLVLFSRFLLLLPYTGLISLRDEDVVKSISLSGAFVFTNCFMNKRELGAASLLGVLGGNGWALKALGWDVVVGGVVAMGLAWGGGV